MIPRRTLLHALLAWAALALPLSAIDLVKDGQPLAVVVTVDGQMGKGIRSTKAGSYTDGEAAKVLIDWLEKITDVRLPLVKEAPPGQPAIFVGQAALANGLSLADLASPSREGLRVLAKGERLLLAGQDGPSTVRAACRLLEKLGCRFFMDAPMGEVFPRTKSLSVPDFEHQEMPGLLYRSFWGSSYYFPSLWRTWHGDGGLPMGMGHSWATYVPKAEYGEAHPEYFTLLDGQRNTNVEWLCTSNQQVREIFVSKLLALAKEQPQGSFSISPPDNRQYCQCAPCRAQDDPEHRERSSGAISMSARYLHFYNEIGRRIYQEYPEVTLNFYCYADYTEPPRQRVKAAPNLVAWIAPIRYSRYHRIGSPVSPSKLFEQEVIEGWSQIVGKLAYRAYNANLAESTVPYAKLSTWQHDLPYLKRRGAIGINNESFVAWGLMGPHLYQSLRLMYDPDLDADALMADYFTKFYGPASAPMKRYWLTIDQAFQDLRSEAGCFYALHLVYTPERLAALQALLDQATTLAGDDATLKARITLADQGLKMAWDYAAFRTALNAGQPILAKEVADRMLQRAKADQVAFHNKTLEYLNRFICRIANAAVAQSAAPRQLLQVLPDTWQMRADPELIGHAQGWHLPATDTQAWASVKTYSATLSEQGIADQPGFQWYRVRFTAPAKQERLLLFFSDIDGAPETSRLFINGQEIIGSAGTCAFEPNRGATAWRRREPLWAFIEPAVIPGAENTLALLLDHRSISENALGGVVRPVYLIGVPAAPAAP